MKQQQTKTEYNFTKISPTRIDLFVSKQFPDLSRTKIQKIIASLEPETISTFRMIERQLNYYNPTDNLEV